MHQSVPPRAVPRLLHLQHSLHRLVVLEQRRDSVDVAREQHPEVQVRLDLHFRISGRWIRELGFRHQVEYGGVLEELLEVGWGIQLAGGA